MKKLTPVILSIVIFCAVFLTGCHLSHDWQAATCTKPETCSGCDKTRGEPKGHVWVDATCQAAKRCKVCWEEEGQPLPHQWNNATCTEDQTCAVCGTIGDLALGHSWTQETDTTPSMCRNCDEMLPMAEPYNGQVFIGTEPTWGSTLTVSCSYSQSCYVKMKDENYNDVISFYIAAGSTAEVCVPSGYYYVYFAHGTDWYGPEYLFGKETTYSKDDELTDYVNYSWEYELEPSTNGNFSDTPIDPNEF